MVDNRTGPRVLAEQKKSIYVLLDYTGPLNQIPVSDVSDGINASCRATSADTRFSATDSARESDPAICEPANAEFFGASNYEGSIGAYRYAEDESPGEHSEQYDELFQALREKGTEAVAVIRDLGKRWDDPVEAGDEVSAFRFTVDNWQFPASGATGVYQKAIIPCAVSDGAMNSVLIDDTTGGD